MRSGFFWRLLFLSLLVICLSIYWGTISFRNTNREMRFELKRQSDLFLVRILDEARLDPPSQMRRFQGLRDQLSILSSQLWIVDESGLLLASSSAEGIPGDWRKIQPSDRLHEFRYVTVSGASGPSFLGVARLTEKGRFLVTLDVPLPLFKQLVQRYTGIVVVSAFLGIATILIVGFIYLRHLGRVAERVFGDIQRGELHSRFPASRINRMTHLMDHFNRMADELVRLVDTTQAAEKARFTLLRELSHDLRTPIAAIRGITENLSDYADRLNLQERESLLASARNEITYLQTLVDDLFFLAEMNEPKYRKNSEEISLAKLLESDILMLNRLAERTTSGVCFELHLQCKPERTLMLADSRLMQRALRNLLDNCARFARSTTAVTLSCTHGALAISIEDDGPGFPADLLNSGAPNRSWQATGAPTKSLGLEISSHIFGLHAGRLELRNAMDENGLVCGAVFEVTFNGSLKL
ncbi:MAG: hypothetical protein RLZZ618_4122 [Pseudomonadota bacterium]|jgi:signal transduction histidine kinase